MGYYLNTNKISLDEYKKMLTTKYLIPSQRPLLENIDSSFLTIAETGIETMEQLYLALKTKKKAEKFSETYGLDLEYLILLRRAVSSHYPTPRKLSDYPDISQELMNKLTEVGVKTSADLYEFIMNNGIDSSAVYLNESTETIKLLAKLMDVTRLRYVSPLFATVLVKSGNDSVKKIAETDENTLYENITSTNKLHNIYKGNIGKSDALFLIDDAKLYHQEL